jgi:hypothetical protein
MSSQTSATRVRIHSTKGPAAREMHGKVGASKSLKGESETNSRVRDDSSNESLERIHTFALKSTYHQSIVGL